MQLQSPPTLKKCGGVNITTLFLIICSCCCYCNLQKYYVDATIVEEMGLPLLWSDEFLDGSTTVNEGSWNVIGKGKDSISPTATGDGQIQTFAEDHVGIISSDVGALNVLVTLEEPDEFVSGSLNTQGKVAFLYGNLVARIMAPDVGSGLWPTFGTMGHLWSADEKDGLSWPTSTSVSIMELGQGLGLVDGYGNERVVSAMHWAHNGTHAAHGDYVDAGVPLNATYNSYAMVWTSEYIATYINDIEIARFDIRLENCAQCEQFHEPQFVTMAVGVGGGFTTDGCDSIIVMDCSPIRTSTEITAPLPASMSVDYVRIYDNGETSLFLNGELVSGTDRGIVDVSTGTPSPASKMEMAVTDTPFVSPPRYSSVNPPVSTIGTISPATAVPMLPEGTAVPSIAPVSTIGTISPATVVPEGTAVPITAPTSMSETALPTTTRGIILVPTTTPSIITVPTITPSQIGSDFVSSTPSNIVSDVSSDVASSINPTPSNGSLDIDRATGSENNSSSSRTTNNIIIMMMTVGILVSTSTLMSIIL